MGTKNPYLEEKHNLIRLYDKYPSWEILTKLKEIEAKIRSFTQEQIGVMDSKLESLRSKTFSVSKDYQSKAKQYQTLILLYREVMKLAKEISELKKEMRMEK